MLCNVMLLLAVHFCMQYFRMTKFPARKCVAVKLPGIKFSAKENKYNKDLKIKWLIRLKMYISTKREHVSIKEITRITLQVYH